MKRKALIAAGALLALVAAFVGGRYSRPARVEERVRVETREVVKVEWRDRVVQQKGPVRVHVVIRDVPGKERIVEKWIDRGPVTTTTDATGAAQSTTTADTSAERVTENGRPGWRASVAAGWDPDALALRPEVYEGRVERRVLGTLWLGVFGRSDKTGGLSAAMEW